MTPVSHTLESPRPKRRYEGDSVLEHTGGRRVRRAESSTIAQRFVAARSSGAPLAAFPGRLPADLAAAYAVPGGRRSSCGRTTVAGWKVGLDRPRPGRRLQAGPPRGADLPPQRALGRRRAAARVSRCSRADSRPSRPSSCCCLGRDAPPGEARVDARGGVRARRRPCTSASRPPAARSRRSTISGRCAIVADFGNNAGLIVGPELPGWRDAPVEEWRCESFVDGASVGRGHGGVAPGGPFESLRFLLGLSARRSRPLKAGDWVSTGAITGVHEIVAGQTRARLVSRRRRDRRARPSRSRRARGAADGASRC